MSGFVTWKDGDFKTFSAAMAKAGDAYESYGTITDRVSVGHFQESFVDIDENINARSPFSRSNYEYFRPNEALPKGPKSITKRCMDAAEQVGILKNILDLMSDFGVQGARVIHPSPSIQKFYRAWWEKVRGGIVSERFLNLLYRCAIVVVKRSTAKIRQSTIKDMMSRAEPDFVNPKDDVTEVLKNEIPWKYTFLNPLSIETLGEQLAPFTGKYVYTIKIPRNIVSLINQVVTGKIRKSGKEKEALMKMIEGLPKDILESVKASKNKDTNIILDQSKLRVAYYKKDDWETWPKPMAYSILKDLIALEKMKLADIAALDGIISSVRLWRLGSLEEKIMPTRAMINKLVNILTNNVGGGSYDIVWGPELDFKESASNAHQFLGSAKYEPILTAIYQGLGIPTTLAGSAGKSPGGFTNNFMSLKTLVERLEYGRDRLREFWNEEFKLVQKARGFRQPAKLEFDHIVLSDESAERALLIQLADRGYLSIEALLQRFKEDPEMEMARLQHEENLRDAGKLPPKAGPWNDPQMQEAFMKLFIQAGAVTPSEVGLELEERKEGEKTIIDHQTELKDAQQKMRGQPQQGRPINSKDSKKRKQKVVKPRSKASEFVQLTTWAKNAQRQIDELVNPVFLSKSKKANLRQLTAKEGVQLENLKFGVLLTMKPHSTISKESVGKGLAKWEVNPMANKLYRSIFLAYSEKVDRETTLEDERHIKSAVYALIQGEEDE